MAQRALDAVHGVDINPYAVAIARFRLLIAAMEASSSSIWMKIPPISGSRSDIRSATSVAGASSPRCRAR